MTIGENMRAPGRASAVCVCVLVTSLLAACTPEASPTATPEATPAATTAGTASPRTGMQEQAARHAMAQRIMHRRERAVRTGDERLFLADVDPGNAALRDRQRRLFANLSALPIETFTLDAAESTWPAGFAAKRFRATAYIPYVEQRLQLRGFDPVPVTTTYALTLARVGGRWRIVADHDLAGREPEAARNTPWELARIVVRRTPHALGIFDAGSQASADRLMAWTEESVSAVQEEVPLRWRGEVVFYALSSQRLLRRMGTRFLDRAAVAFPVLDDSENPTRVVGTRVVINPQYLPRNELEGTYLLTHEITHVALARTNGETPAWVQEGLAEYVATKGADPSWWRPAASTVQRASEGVDAMPGSTFFGDKDPGFEYDLSLAAFAYLADRFGTPAVWRFLDRLAAASRTDGDREAHTDQVLRRSFRLDSGRLADRAAAFIVRRGG